MMLLLSTLAGATLYPLYLTQKIDHFDASKGTFSQTFYYNNSFAKYDPYKTFIVVLGGMERFKTQWMDTEPIIELAKKTGAVILGLETRFFGDSLPEDFSNESYQYLNIDQILADIATFIDTEQSQFCDKGSCRVTVVGAGFGGSLAAWMKRRYPHMVEAAWASSAPLKAINELTVDSVTGEELNKFNSQCYIRTGDLIEALYHSPTPEMFTMFGMNGYSNTTLIQVICDVLDTAVLNKTLDDLLYDYCTSPMEMKDLALLFNRTCLRTDLSPAKLTPYTTDMDSQNAFFMQCSELGWFRTATLIGPRYRLRPRSVNPNYYSTACEARFGKKLVSREEFNRLHEGILSSTIVTSGQRDLWSPVRLIQSNSSIEEVYFYDTGDESMGADLQSNMATDGAQLRAVRAEAVARLSSWINFNCEDECEHGSCMLHRCICDEGYGGKKCHDRMTHYSSFLIATISSTVIPTVLMIIVSLLAWNMVIRMNEIVPQKEGA